MLNLDMNDPFLEEQSRPSKSHPLTTTRPPIFGR